MPREARTSASSPPSAEEAHPPPQVVLDPARLRRPAAHRDARAYLGHDDLAPPPRVLPPPPVPHPPHEQGHAARSLKTHVYALRPVHVRHVNARSPVEQSRGA